MLLYKPPFLEGGDLTIFRDDKDPHTYYYAVINPSIIIKEEKPALYAYAIIPESGLSEDVEDIVDATLIMEVALEPMPGSLERAKEEIKKAFKKEAKILAPVPVVEGNVFLSIASIEEEEVKKEWFITTGVSPSIIGNNKVALTVKTRGENAKRMIAALNSDLIAGSVFYDLKILGISPVYHAKMNVRWEKVYRHLEEHKITNHFFSREEISKAVDDLKETSAIEILVEELDPDVKDFAAKSLFNELKTEVIKRLFQPTTPPLSAAKKWENRVISGISRLFSSIIPGSHYQLLKVEEHQLSTTTIDLWERKAKKYPIYPQALLTSLIRQAGGLKDYLKWIQEADLPFSSEQVTVSLAANTFEGSNIQSVKLECKVLNNNTARKVESTTLVYDKTQKLTQYIRYTRQRDHKYEFAYRATIYLDSSNDDSLIPSRLELDWQKSNNEFIYFNAAEYFEPVNLTIAIDDNSILEQAAIIEVQMDVNENSEETTELKDYQPMVRKTFLFKKDAIEAKNFSFIMTRTTPYRIDLNLIYYLSGTNEFQIDIKDLKEDYYFIPNPFENKWSIELMSAVDWEETLKIIIEIRVLDVVRNEYIFEKLRFTEDKDSEILHFVTSLETLKETCEVRYNVIKKDATVIRSDWLQHQGSILVVTDQIKAERTIKAQLIEAPDFAEKGIKKVYIKFKYKDSKNDIKESSKSLYFKEVGDETAFTHPMPDLTMLVYTYQVTAISKRGKRYKTKWLEAVKDNLKISLPDDLW